MRAKLDCGEVRSLIDAAVDGELDAIGRMSFDEHLATCPDCAAAHAERQAFVLRLRTTAQRFAAPDSLRARLSTDLPRRADPATVPSAPPRWRWLTGGAWIASAAALAASLMLFFAPPNQQDALTHELVAAHVRSLLPDHLTDVPSSDRHTVKPWFNGKVDLSPPVPDLAGKGFPLIGGRLDYIDDHTAAALVYRRDRHVINLFVWAVPGAATQAPETTGRNGYHLAIWTRDGLRYAAVSDVALADLEDFQRLWVLAAADGESENGTRRPEKITPGG